MNISTAVKSKFVPPKGWITTFDEYRKCLESNTQGKGKHTQRIQRLEEFKNKIQEDPLQYLLKLYFTERKTLREINEETGIYKDSSSLFSLLKSLGWELYSPNEEGKIQTREPKRQESFHQRMGEKVIRQKEIFRNELKAILDDSSNIARRIFLSEEYGAIKSEIKKFLYLLETFDGIMKEMILLSCSETHIESSYYFEVFQDKITKICTEHSITPVPKVTKDNLRAWVRNNSK